MQYNTDNQNVYQDGQGNLVLEARKSNPEGLQCWYGPCDYTSARITTSGHFSFTYGRLEARIKIPYGQGLWSGLWLLGSNVVTVGWPLCGEVDIMENIGKEPAEYSRIGTRAGEPCWHLYPFLEPLHVAGRRFC